MKVAAQLLLGVFMPLICQAQTNTPCSGGLLSTDQMVTLQTRLFDALEHDNRAAWDRLVTPTFQAQERGRQYNGRTFFEVIASAHKEGIKLKWSVTEPHIEVDCRLALMSYVNVGSIAQPSEQAKPQLWLETVAFRREGSTWLAVLLTSVRADEDSPNRSQSNAADPPVETSPR